MTIVVVCRAAARQFDVDGFLARHPELRPESVWRTGEQRSPRRVNDTSGFNVSLAEADRFAEALARTREALDRLSPALKDLKAHDLEVEVDFGLMVGAEPAFTLGAQFAPEVLAWFSDRGLTLIVSAYPCSDEERS